MKCRHRLLVVWCWLALSAGPAGATPRQSPDDGVAALLKKLERLMMAGKPEAYTDLLGTYADRTLARNAAQILIAPTVTRAVLRERDRAPLDGTLPGDGHRLMVEAFIEYGNRARVSTWRFDVRRISSDDGPDEWVIIGQAQITVVDGLYRLSLNPLRQYRAQDLVVRAEDLEIKLARGRVFVSETQEGTTAVVLLPEGGATFTFKPSPDTEREQIRLFAGADQIEDGYSEVFLRMNPSDFREQFSAATVQLEPVDDGALRRAETVFREEVGKSFGLDMSEFSRDTWSLTPNDGDLLAEIRTQRFQTLTYARSTGDSEDVTLFDRRRRKNLAVYSSRERISERGRFFNEDDSAAYDITDYLVEARFVPERNLIDGRSRLRLRVRSSSLNSLTLKLADSLTVRSVFSPDLGRLLFLRVRNQNSIVVNLPATVTAGVELALVVEYGGPLLPSRADREAVAFDPRQQDPFLYDVMSLPGEPNWLYTTRTYWYPQSPVSDYAPALLRLTVPTGFTVLASGELMSGFPVTVPPLPGQKVAGRQFVFSAPQPLRYLSCLVSRFVRVGAKAIDLRGDLTAAQPDGTRTTTRLERPGVFYDSVALSVDSNPRLHARGLRMMASAEDVTRFYAGLVGDSPYPSLAIGLIENELPGGHSPAYLSVVHQPLPQVNFSWGNDPAAFPNYAEFFTAHEIAHQWWGQAIGWQSYHEQWISEGFAQYFAALYARHLRGEQAFQDVMRRMARFARDQSGQGPISLGYRLGHVRGDSRVFRSLVYNKAAVVLDTLRQLLGDDLFMRGMRRFYFDWRFKKASTINVQRAFEIESGRNLDNFFEGWIHTSAIPSVKFSWKPEGTGPDSVAVVVFDQVGPVFDLPIPVTLQFADRTTRTVIVPVRGRTTEFRIPFTGDLRDIAVNDAGVVLVDVER